MCGEPANQVDRVLRGAGSLRTGADQRDGELGAGAAFPEDLDLGDVLRTADGDDDLADQRPEELLAVTVGGCLRLPQLRQVSREAGQRFALGLGERCGTGVLQRRERALLPCDTGKRVLELALERACDEPVLRFARVELALSALCLDLGAFQRESLAGEPGVVLLGQLGPPVLTATPAGVTASRNAAATALSSRPPPSPWHEVSVPCSWNPRTHA